MPVHTQFQYCLEALLTFWLLLAEGTKAVTKFTSG